MKLRTKRTNKTVAGAFSMLRCNWVAAVSEEATEATEATEAMTRTAKMRRKLCCLARRQSTVMRTLLMLLLPSATPATWPHSGWLWLPSDWKWFSIQTENLEALDAAAAGAAPVVVEFVVVES